MWLGGGRWNRLAAVVRGESVGASLIILEFGDDHPSRKRFRTGKVQRDGCSPWIVPLHINRLSLAVGNAED